MSENQTAGAFDIRNIIGIVIGVFGVILVVVGLFFSPADELAKSGGIRANLIAGIVMILAAAVFIAWSLLRPVVVPVDPTPGEP
jgi:drug/metabolite transporter (DMT)-like permease